MQFIQDKLKGQGQVAYVISFSIQNNPGFSMVYRIRTTYEEVMADPGTCTLRDVGPVDQSIETYQGGEKLAAGTYDQHSQVSRTVAFKDVEKITVESLQDVMNRKFAESGHPENIMTVAPPVFVVGLLSSKPVFSIHVSTTKDSEAPKVTDITDTETLFNFRDEDMANRMAKAMVHAVELCGGGSKPEPF